MMEVTPDRNPSYFYGEEDSEEVYEEDVEAHVDLSQLQKTKKTVGEMVDKFVSTGDAGIDEKMRGGFMCSGITELVGESASGKTQFGLQLCLSVQRNSSQLGKTFLLNRRLNEIGRVDDDEFQVVGGYSLTQSCLKEVRTSLFKDFDKCSNNMKGKV